MEEKIALYEKQFTRERMRISTDEQGYPVKADLYRQDKPLMWRMVAFYKGVTSEHRFIRHEDAIENFNRFFYEKGRDIVFDDWRKKPGKARELTPPSNLPLLLELLTPKTA